MREASITKKADDPAGIVRVSVGGLGAEIPNGVYVVYRGSKENAIEALRIALRSMEGVAAKLGPDHDLEIEPDNGKQFS